VSPLANGGSIPITAAIAIAVVDGARLRSAILSSALFGEAIGLAITLVMLSFPRDPRATKLASA